MQTLEEEAEPKIAALLRPFQPWQICKIGQARQASLSCERGCILLPQSSEEVPWLYEIEDKLYKFPAARLNDLVDSLAQAVLFLKNLLAEGLNGRQQS